MELKLNEAICIIIKQWEVDNSEGAWYGYDSLFYELKKQFLFRGNIDDMKIAIKNLVDLGELVREYLHNEGKMAGSGYFFKDNR